MKKIDLNQTISILANVGVIVGIVFLAFEINQNSKQLQAQAQFNYMQSRVDVRLQRAYDPEFASFSLKAFSGEKLTEVEQSRLQGILQATLLQIEWEFAQTMDGNLPNDRQSLIAKWRSDWRPRFLSDEMGKQLEIAWSALRPSFNPEFTEFFEEEIIGPM